MTVIRQGSTGSKGQTFVLTCTINGDILIPLNPEGATGSKGDLIMATCAIENK